MAAIVEQHHDDKGIQWPASVAPYDVHIIVIPGQEEQARRQSLKRFPTQAVDVLLDDRDARAGEKFADADLIGCPVRVTVGRKVAEDGTVDVRERAKGDDRAVSVGEVVSTVARDARLMARKRRFSDDAFGPTIERLMAEAGLTYRSLAEKTRLSAGYLNHLVHGNRPVPSDDVIKTLARALGVEAEHFREYRLRVITDRLERMPDLIDKLYRRYSA